MKKNQFIVALFVLTFAVLSTEAQKSKFQISFSMENDIRKSVKIPEYVFAEIVRRDEYVAPNERKEAIAGLKERSQAALVNLNDDGKADLLVQGDPGANITGFWLFRNVGGKWKYMLETRAHSLRIQKAKTKGYYNIGIAAASAVVLWESVYKFDGKNYLPKICRETTDDENGKTKKTTYKCPGSISKPYV